MPKNSIKKGKSIKIKRTSILVVFVIVSFFLGRYSYYLESGSLPADLMLTPGKTYQQGLDEAKNTVEKRLLAVGLFPQSVMQIGGALVKSINGQNIVVEFDPTVVDLLKEGKITKTVLVPDGVSIEQHIPKPQEEMEKIYTDFQKKADEIQKKMSNGQEAEIIDPPLPYTIKTLKLSDLKAGDVVSIESKTDVRDSDTFEAVSIQLISQL